MKEGGEKNGRAKQSDMMPSSQQEMLKVETNIKISFKNKDGI